MGTLGTILMLLAFLGFFIGIVGVIKGSVKFIKLRSRKASGLFIVTSFVVFMIGGFMLPADTSTISTVEKQASSNVEEKKENTNTLKVKEEKKQEAIGVSETKTVEDELEVHFVDVGQGAAQVIIAPNKKVMVIDGGNNDDEDDMVAYLKKLGISKVDILIGTHPDADHIGGIDAVIDSFDIGKIYMPNAQRDTQTFESVLQSIQYKGLKVTTAKAGIELDLDPTVQIKMISPIGTDSDENEMSAVVRLQIGEQSFLLTGDAGVSTEEKWLQAGENLQSTVLLTGHHGSEHSTSEAFVKAVQPKHAVIQVGKNNYGHPTSEVLDRLDNHKVNIYRNDTDGTIVFKTDGSKMEINKNAWVHTPDTKSSANNQPTTPPAPSNIASNIQANATIDDANPDQNEEVTVMVTVKDQNGYAVNGANVHLSLSYKSTDTVYEGTTNANGIAALSFKIGRAAAGFTVNGDITVSANGKTATTQTAFTPK